MNWETWLKAAGIRCIKTMAQAAIAIIGTSAVMADIDWKIVVSSAVVAGILSLLTSLAGLPEVDAEGTYIFTLDDTEEE